MTKKNTTNLVPITARALVQRLNRKLAEQDQVLKKSRGARTQLDLGDYYVIDFRRNFVVDDHCDLAELGREFEVLRDYEEVVEEES
jgi:hypothetical protein